MKAYRGEQLLRAFIFDAANHMTAALQIKDGVENDPLDNSIVSGAETGNQRLIELAKADARAIGFIF